MKPKRKPAGLRVQNSVVASRRPPEGEVAPPRSPRRTWAFRLIAALVLPVLILGSVEGVLRLAGYGHPTSFFLRQRINGHEMLVENTWFGLRFFPPALARSPAPLAVPAKKEAGVYRVFLFGESAALGDPRPAYGMGRYLEILLRARYPGVPFEVIPVAMTAINSHAVLPIAQECARDEGDLWLVYMGNNEFVGPFGANTVFGPRALGATAVRAYLAIERLRLGQLALAWMRRLQQGVAPPQTWGGLKMFLDHELAPSDPRRARVYENFRENVRAIRRAGERAGVPVVLSSVASNLKDCAPFASARGQSAIANPSAWEAAFLSGTAAAAQGHWPEARAHLEKAAQLDPEHADVHFELGRCFAARAEWTAAGQQFRLARDFDALPFRADSRLNSIVEQAAQTGSNSSSYFVDAEKALVASAPEAVPGDDSFFEHVHLRPEGNYRLARAFAQEIAQHLPNLISQRQTAPWLTPDLCAQQLALTEWNRASMLEEILQRLDEPPFTTQSHHAPRMERLSVELQDLKMRMGSNTVAEARSTYERAIGQRPGDHWLHHSFAEFLKSTGDLAGAVAQMEQVCQLVPHHYSGYLQLGRLLARQRKPEEARQALHQALAIRPDLAEVYVELGQIDATEGRLEPALENYAHAQRLRPDDAGTCLLKARIYDQQNKTAEAIQSLQQAIALRPNNWETRYQLALHFNVDHQFQAAESQLQVVLKLHPAYSSAHLHLGFALARQNRFDEALAQFRETLRLEPNNAQAQQFLETIEQLKRRASAPQSQN